MKKVIAWLDEKIAEKVKKNKIGDVSWTIFGLLVWGVIGWLAFIFT